MTTTSTPNGLTLTSQRLAPLAELRLTAGPHEEATVILLSGQLGADGTDGTSSSQRVTRRDPFTDPANGWYLPGRASLAVTAGEDATDVIIVRSPTCAPGTPTTRPSGLPAPVLQTRGTGSWEREVTTLLTPPTSVGLLLGETLARDGRWSTYPPHRHEHSNPPHESALQEAFVFRVRPASGFGVLLTYDHEVTQARSTVLSDGTVATVPGGFHTVAAAAGHDLYYLWAAHGAVDTHFALYTDPQHAWLLSH